jgi:formylglycine-generating enzyme required for sulfatase activity
MKDYFSLLIILVMIVAWKKPANAASPKSQIVRVGNVVFKMVYVEPGTFTMGAISDEDYDEREHPSHKVTLTKGYYIGEAEVTQSLWETVMGNNPSESIGRNNPVDNVNWNDCQAFISILNSITGGNFRLPTEAEWEFASKGGNLSKGYIYSGSNHADDVAWYIVNSGDTIQKDKIIIFTEDNNNRTHEVKSKKPNELGLYDMSGNVSEWCEDGYAEYPSENLYDPKGVSTSKKRVKRGGDFKTRSRSCRNTHRYGSEPEFCIYSSGFRLVMEE